MKLDNVKIVLNKERKNQEVSINGTDYSHSKNLVVFIGSSPLPRYVILKQIDKKPTFIQKALLYLLGVR